jgi:hypothetical protein
VLGLDKYNKRIQNFYDKQSWVDKLFDCQFDQDIGEKHWGVLYSEDLKYRGSRL